VGSRLAPPEWRLGASPESYEGAVRASWLALVVAIASSGIPWLSRLERLFLAENKLVQACAAAELGIRTPRSVVASTRHWIPHQLGEPLVVKPLGPGDYLHAAGIGQVVFATELPRRAPELDDLAGAPFLAQEKITAERHLRIVTVGDKVWGFELEASALPLDWRAEDVAHDAFRSAASSDEITEQALAIAAAVGVGYSSQDWVVDTTGPVFLDLNPGGQWLFLPEPGATAITEAIARWLAV
jgi:glutathione synthase/RimK-type ligase-like ATP-grasp enzyme